MKSLPLKKVKAASDEIDETEGESPTDDETTPANLLVIEPSIHESDSESLARIKMENSDDRDDASTVISTISDDICEVRKLRTLDMSEYLTDERAQEIIIEVSRLLEQEDDIHVKQEALRRIHDAIGAAQEGLDLAFAAGTLSTTACIAREDSARYKDRLSKEEITKALGDAKAGLKRALNMANKLEKDKFKIVRQWLRYDDDTAANTIMFFERVRKEIKRSLRVTVDTIKHPGSLGAKRKGTGASQMYPSLPPATEMTEEDKTLKWVNDTSKLTTHVKIASTADTIPGHIPEKPQTGRTQNNKNVESERRPDHDTFRSAPPSYDGHQPEPVAPKAHLSASSNVASSTIQTEEVKRQKKREQLERRRVPIE